MTGTIGAAMREIIDRVYPVGIILDFAQETDPNSAIGCGTAWERMDDGRTLIASDSSHAVGWTGGAETVALTVEQMPSHQHTVAMNGDPDYLLGAIASTGTQGSIHIIENIERTANEFLIRTVSSGGGQAHENMQPSLAVCRWKRTA